MIPFVKEMVPVVDKPAGRILITPPEGLLDLTSTRAVKVSRCPMHLSYLALASLHIMLHIVLL